MNAQVFILVYLLPCSIALMVLWLCYRLLFVNSKSFQFNRFFLLTAMLFGLALPLFGTLFSHSSALAARTQEQWFSNIFMLNEITITPNGISPEGQAAASNIAGPAKTSLSLWQVLGILYLAGVIVSFLIFFTKILKITILTLRSPKEKRDGYTLVYTHCDNDAFSFLHYAYFPDKNISPDILRHELSHINQHHSIDILFTELMMILQWFNPFIYLYKKDLQLIHEYAADHEVLHGGADKGKYMYLILQQCTAVNFSDMSNNFNLLFTKKRIKMITSNEKTRRLWWRLLVIMPVLAALLVASPKVTAQGQTTAENSSTKGTDPVQLFDDYGVPQFENTVIYNEDGSYLKFETTDAIDPVTNESHKQITLTSFNADGTANDQIQMKEEENNGNGISYSVEPFSISTGEDNETKISSNDLKVKITFPADEKDSVYNKPEVMPEFPGGMEAMMKYLSENLKYPETAKEKNTQGRVLVTFIVEKNGSISDVKVVKGIGNGCDEEAVRVIKAMPKWKPGMQNGKKVRVSFAIPISFKLQ
ncbi:MAG: TonB family protein [Bacteroidales bacterium]|nr:TonB family protein [Bacteroidales bacterium]